MAPVAHVEEWVDDCATIAEIEAALVDLRYRHSHGGEPDLRTSVLTHLAWVPPEWQEQFGAPYLTGLGASGVAGGCSGHAGGARRAPPVADAPTLSASR